MVERTEASLRICPLASARRGKSDPIDFTLKAWRDRRVYRIRQMMRADNPLVDLTLEDDEYERATQFPPDPDEVRE